MTDNEEICAAIREAGDKIAGAIREGFGLSDLPSGVLSGSLLATNAEETNSALRGIDAKLEQIVQLLQRKSF